LVFGLLVLLLVCSCCSLALGLWPFPALVSVY
jgi:hypothetical protein